MSFFPRLLSPILGLYASLLSSTGDGVYRHWRSDARIQGRHLPRTTSRPWTRDWKTWQCQAVRVQRSDVPLTKTLCASEGLATNEHSVCDLLATDEQSVCKQMSWKCHECHECVCFMWFMPVLKLIMWGNTLVRNCRAASSANGFRELWVVSNSLEGRERIAFSVFWWLLVTVMKVVKLIS